MSFIQSTVRCNSCKKEYNVAFGIVGNTIIADGGPKECPNCSGELKKSAMVGMQKIIKIIYEAFLYRPRSDPYEKQVCYVKRA